MAQLMIDRRQKEIDRIVQHKASENSAIQDQRQKMLELENHYRMNRNQADAEMVRARKAMDAAIRRRSELSQEL
jgi:hypothetical protein